MTANELHTDSSVNTIKVAHHTVILDKPPCCIAFCPADPDHFVVGTYHLKKDENGDGHRADGAEDTEISQPQVRDGSLIVFKIRDSHMVQVSEVSTESAILDIKFRPCKDPSLTTTDLFAAATSTGSVVLYTIIRSPEGDEEQLKIKEALKIQVFEESDVMTSLAWDPENQSRIHVTAASGRVATIRMDVPGFAVTAMKGQPLVEADAESADAPLALLGTHDLEAWIVEPAYVRKPDGSAVYMGLISGGDDAAFQLLPAGPASPVAWKNRRLHQAGVTAFRPLSCDGTSMIVATGSYDDHLRLIRIPLQQGRPELVTEVNLSGGVWRINILSTANKVGFQEWRLLIACMYNGSFIVRVRSTSDSTQWEEAVVEHHFMQHESMCYAAEVQQRSGDRSEGSSVIASCSFYDRRLCLWTV